MKKENNISETATFDKKKSANRLLVVITVAILLCVAVASTVYAAISYARNATPPVEDTFVPAVVSCQVTETSNGSFTVTNTGNVPVYLRVYVAPSFVDSSGQQHWTAPACNISSSGWTLYNGFYYYNSEIAPGGTANITASFGGGTVPTGYSFNVDLSAEVIQSNPKTAAAEAWGYNFD